ncbi:glutathione S-transferase [Stachybotrys elegans]|uniref:glutathione transferase n=1 Tax=Stachybotrys elegans TaxID=80388 RepID=A0A8K0T5B8_9HYPO|nr:glutathione S-transferase [Stachybotrys elegans]
MSDLKPITLYVHARGPNPKKVIIFLEELGVPYNSVVIANSKEESYLAINPNGRLPAIVDPNNDDLTLWESGAILEYISEKYDGDNKFSPVTDKEKWQAKQYLHFQMSGQGPYYGQYMWFNFFHPEQVPSAKERYGEQIVRVFGVLDRILKDKEYLVGDRLTYVDLAFIPWDKLALGVLDGELAKKYDVENKYPNFYAWHKRLVERPSVTKAFTEA